MFFMSPFSVQSNQEHNVLVKRRGLPRPVSGANELERFVISHS